MVDHSVSCLSAHNVKNFDGLWVGRVDHGEDIRTEGQMSLVQELNSETLVLRCRDDLTLVGIDIEVLTRIDQGEVLSSLNDQENYILDIKHEGRGPVLGVVDVALRSCADYQVVVPHAHVNNPLSEIKIVIHFI